MQVTSIMSETRYYGAVINPQERNPKKPISYDVYSSCRITVSAEGKITDFTPGENPEGGDNEVVLKSDEFFMPGFIDTHTVRGRFVFSLIGRVH